MKKFLLILFIILLSISPISAKTLQGGVEYTETQIKKMAFDGVKKKLPRKMIEANKIDPFYDENMLLKEKGQKETDDRVIFFYKDGGYSIVYKQNIREFYIYDSIGNFKGLHLFLISKTTTKTNLYPLRSIYYDKNGILLRIVYSITDKESYIYNANGDFIKKH